MSQYERNILEMDKKQQIKKQTIKINKLIYSLVCLGVTLSVTDSSVYLE